MTNQREVRSSGGMTAKDVQRDPAGWEHAVALLGTAAGLALRPATATDFPAVAQLFAALHRFNADLDARFALAADWQELLHEHFKRSHTHPGALWLLAWAPAQQQGEADAVGLLVMESHVDSPLFHERRWAELVALYVTEAQRGGALGIHLVAAAKAWAEARGFDRMQLYVTASNERAKRFYARCGFYPAQEIWRTELTPQPGVTPPPDPSDHLHPELGSHHLAMELHAREEHRDRGSRETNPL